MKTLHRSWDILSQHLSQASRPILILLFFLTTPHLQAIHDTNQNGVSDLWEKKYNSGALYLTFIPTADPDADGWTNAQEAAAGTDPTTGVGPTGHVRTEITHTPAVYLSPEEEGGPPQLVTPEVMTNTWPTVAGKKYTLLFSTDLTAGNWTAIGSPRIGAGTEIGTSIPLTQPDGSTPAALFWRVTIADIDTDSDTLTDTEEAELGSRPYSSDGDNDGLSDLAELFTYYTNPVSRDSDGDGVSDPDEILLNFTNPLTATDADGDRIPDDLEKELAKQFLSFQPDPAAWGIYYTGLAAGNLDSNHDYTGDGVSVGKISSVLIGDPYNNQSSGSSPYFLERQRRQSYFGGTYRPASEGQPVSIKGGIALSLTRDTNTTIKTSNLADFSYQYLNQNYNSAIWYPFGRIYPLGSPDWIDGEIGGVNWSCANFQDYPTTDGSRSPYGTFIQTRFRVFSNKISQAGFERSMLKVTTRSPALVAGTLLNTTFSAELIPFSLKNGRFYSDWVETQTTMIDSQSTQAIVNQVDIISDLDNDGQITPEDHLLRDAAVVSGATDEIKDKGTEFIFQNDNLSNGIWDKDDTDPARPIAAKDDDDAEPINLRCTIFNGEVWLDHPAITGMSFYKSRECRPEDKVNFSPNNKFTVSSSDPIPWGLYMRVDGNLTYPDANPQIEGDLVLKIKVSTTGQEIEAARMKLTVVKAVGAKKYFQTARDYMFENNSKLCVRKEAVGNLASPSYKRFISMLYEKTEMKAVDSFHRNPKLYGIDAVAAGFSAYDVAVNGNFCFHSGLFSRPARNAMTDRCHGRLITSGGVQPCSSAGGSSPYESPISDFIKWNPQGGVSIGTGEVPASSPVGSEALGGFGSNIAQYSWHPWFGIANASDKKVFFNVMPYTVDSTGAGGGADLKNRLMASGCPPLPGGQAGEIQCIYGDGGSSLALAYKVSGSGLTVRTKGEKHFIATGTGIVRARGDYFINTYLLFKSQNPR